MPHGNRSLSSQSENTSSKAKDQKKHGCKKTQARHREPSQGQRKQTSHEAMASEGGLKTHLDQQTMASLRLLHLEDANREPFSHATTCKPLPAWDSRRYVVAQVCGSEVGTISELGQAILSQPPAPCHTSALLALNDQTTHVPAYRLLTSLLRRCPWLSLSLHFIDGQWAKTVLSTSLWISPAQSKGPSASERAPF